MNTGFIYRETASKGMQNGKQVFCSRWCAEINVDGVRRRKRSADYKTLLAWLREQSAPRVNDARRKCHPRRSEDAVRQYRARLKKRESNGELVSIPDYSNYLFDTKNLAMYNIGRACKMKQTRTGSYRIYDDNGDYKYFRPLRLAYALLHKIDYDKIPPSFNIIKGEDGLMRVVVAGETTRENVRKEKTEHRMNMLERCMRETSLIYNCYHTGDDTEVVRFALSQRNGIINRFMKKTHLNYVLSADYYGQALERMVETLKCKDTMLTNITHTVYHYMLIIRSEDKRKRQLYNNKNYEGFVCE